MCRNWKCYLEIYVERHFKWALYHVHQKFMTLIMLWAKARQKPEFLYALQYLISNKVAMARGTWGLFFGLSDPKHQSFWRLQIFSLILHLYFTIFSTFQYSIFHIQNQFTLYEKQFQKIRHLWGLKLVVLEVFFGQNWSFRSQYNIQRPNLGWTSKFVLPS